MTFTPAEHLHLAETLIESLSHDAAAAAAEGNPWFRGDAIALASLHLQAAATRATMRATLLINDESENDPWEPTPRPVPVTQLRP
jgi:hypothetical protein